MLFSADAHGGLADGSTTVTFRRWTRPQAKVGGHYRVAGMMLEVVGISQVRVADITDTDARRAGEDGRPGVLRRLGPGEPDDVVWRVEFRLVGADPRSVLAADADLTAADIDAIASRLDRLDRASSIGPWTRATLALIGERPAVVSTELAATLARDRPAFKLDVRKLKALGLTESLVEGYRLSARGRAFVAATSRSR